MNKKSIAILCGGISSERDISLKTGQAVFDAINPFYNAEQIQLDDNFNSILPKLNNVDLVFNALHGGNGENGVIAEELDNFGIKYTGSGAESSRRAIDKHISKIIARESKILTPNWIWYKNNFHDYSELEQQINSLGYPLVVKPADEGSTVGLTIVESIKEIKNAIKLAFKVSDQLIFEKYIPGRELTVGILDGKSLPVVEIIPKNELYDYECKYTKGMSSYYCPADILNQVEKKIRSTAIQFHELLGCRHYSRVDFRLSSDNKIYLLELNTLPGMTSTSLLPMAAKAEGIDFRQLLEKIIKCGMNE